MAGVLPTGPAEQPLSSFRLEVAKIVLIEKCASVVILVKYAPVPPDAVVKAVS